MPNLGRLRTGLVVAAMCMVPALAQAGDSMKGEFDGNCVMGLALGKDIETDCSVKTDYRGKTYCFGNKTAKSLFLKRPDDFLLQAHIYYSSKQEAAAAKAAGN